MKKILLATDGSKPSLDAARFLAHLPHEDTIELTVATALFVPERTYMVGDWIDACMARERESADEAFAAIESLFAGANIKLRRLVRQGMPGEVVVAMAKEAEAELVVIGATGHSSVARMLLGSTSDYVATHAPCSVLVVRPTKSLQEHRRIRILIGYEESDPARAAMEEFAEFGWTGDTDVRVVSATHEPGIFRAPYEEPSPEFVERAAAQLQDVALSAKGVLIQGDHVGESLVRYIESHEIDLAVIGETPRTRLSRVLMGSMTRFVLRHAPCSVWITRNRTVRDAPKSEVQNRSHSTAR